MKNENENEIDTDAAADGAAALLLHLVKLPQKRYYFFARNQFFNLPRKTFREPSREPSAKTFRGTFRKICLPSGITFRGNLSQKPSTEPSAKKLVLS